MDWKQRKLGEISEKVTEKNKDREFTETLTNSAEYGIVSQSDFFDKKISNSKNIDNYYIVQNNDFIYNPRISNFAPVGPIKRNKLNKIGIMSPLYYVFRTNNIDLTFLEKFFDTSYWHRFMKLNGDTGARADRFAIKDSIFKEMPIPCPNSEEQTKIGNLLKQIDSTIALHQEKLSKLQSLKKAALQSLFPQKNETEPRVRFANFNDIWKQCKLGELANIVRGASPRPIKNPEWFDNKSDIGWLRISDVTKQNGKIYKLEQRLSKKGQKKTRILTSSHLLLSIAATVGKPLINYVQTGVHDGFLIFLDPLFDKEYMFQWLEMFRPKWKRYGQPGSQVNLNSEIVRNQKITIPNLEEQTKIGEFFKQIDGTIGIYQQKLEKLQNFKKAFLQKMFI